MRAVIFLAGNELSVAYKVAPATRSSFAVVTETAVAYGVQVGLTAASTGN